MTQRLFLLRHGEVTSHRGDVPVTEEGLQTAVEVGRRLAGRADGAIRVISGETRRTRDTAAAVLTIPVARAAPVPSPRRRPRARIGIFPRRSSTSW